VRYRMYLESRGLAANTINQQLAAVRRLAHEAADSGLLSPELVAFILARRDSGVDHSDGREHVLAAVDDTYGGRSQSKENDDVDAFDVHFHVRVVSGGIDGLLAGQQSSYNRSAVLDQPQCQVRSVR